MKKHYIGLLFIFLPTILMSQEVLFEWANSIGGSSCGDEGKSITTDIAGNVYTTGAFTNTADFDPGINEFNLTSNGQTDIFIQKLDAQGNLVWAKSIGASGGDEGNSIVIDPSGNIYITGSFAWTVDFNPGDDVFNMSFNGGSDLFILKLNSDGDFIWAKSIGGSSSDIGVFIDLDSSQNIYLSGSFGSTVDFNPSNAVSNLTATRGTNIFILKLDSNGDFIWAKSLDDTNRQTGAASVDSDGNVFLTGSRLISVEGDGRGGTVSEDIAIFKFDSNGNNVWEHSIGGGSRGSGTAITNDEEGNVYISGNFGGPVDFDPGDLKFELSGSDDFFILKLDSDGNFIWAKSLDGAVSNQSGSLATDKLGNLYITGSFFYEADFDPSSEEYILTGSLDDEIFILRLDPSGNFNWAISIGGNSNDKGFAVSSDTFGNIYATGFYIGIVDFDPGQATNNLTGLACDAFVLKLSQKTALAIEDIDEFEKVSIFPNPSQGIVNINLPDLMNVDIKVYNATGQLMDYKKDVGNLNNKIRLNDGPGFYFIEVSSSKRRQFYKIINR